MDPISKAVPRASRQSVSVGRGTKKKHDSKKKESDDGEEP
jgi:hypothetical protein